ncbi:MAG: hypothetical protein ABWX92_18255 [Mycetocola sp.]
MRAIEYREGEFDDEQTQWLIAYGRVERDLGRHGFSMAEATSPDADPNNYDGGYRFIADAPITDWAEKARLDRIDKYRTEAGENANLNGLVFPVRKVDG